MSYLVFSRKFRPELFEEVAGQPHVTETLSRALSTGRVGQAYLFSGPRGIGKTTIARILAKALNCHEGVSAAPCNKCISCLEISKSSSIDVFEIDGASNRRIEEVRDLRENVKFSPARDRFKIYIIDEVHMLTTEAFNALLKTLEEPPEHVKFIFATTAPNKIPLTIISRCQRFELRRISSGEIFNRLSGIADREKIKAEKEALEAIASLASGSMRDAQSIFDQLSCSVEGTLTREDVGKMLGLIPEEIYLSLGEAIRKSDTLAALNIIARIIDEGKDIEQFIKSWLKYWRDMLMIKAGCGELAELPENLAARLETQAESFSKEEILKALGILTSTGELVRTSYSSRIPLEIAAAELTLMKTASPAGLSAKPEAEKPGSPGGSAHSKKSKDQEKTREEKEIDPSGLTRLTLDKLVDSWQEVLESVKQTSVRVHGFLVEGKPAAVDNDEIKISFSAKFHMESCAKSGNCALIEDALEKIFSRRFKTSFIMGNAGEEESAPKDKRPAGKKESDIKKKVLKDPVIKEVSEIFRVGVLDVKEEK